MGNVFLDSKVSPTTVNGDEELKLISRLQKLIDIGTDFIGENVEEWENNTNFYVGRQWSEDKVSELEPWRATPVTNVIFETVETMHSIATDQRPEGFVHQRAGGDNHTAEILSSHMRYLHDDLDIEAKNRTKWKHKLIKGTGYWKVWWDASIKEIQVNVVPCENMLFDPRADTVKEASWIAEKKEVLLTDLVEKYPKLAERLKKQSTKEPTDSSVLDEFNSETVTVWEVWFKDVTLLENDSAETDTDRVEKGKKKYPRGRVVQFTGKVKLEDGKNPYKLEGSGQLWPYVKDVCVELPSSFLGTSVVGPMTFNQEAMNDIEAMIFDNLKTVVNSLFVSKTGAVDVDTFTNQPGSLLEIDLEDNETLDGVFRREQGTNISSDVFRFLADKQESTRRISGLNDALQGSSGPSQRPGAVRAAFEAALGRIREMIRHDNESLAKMGEIMVDLMQQFYPVGRMVYLIDEEDISFDAADPANQGLVADALADTTVKKELNSRLRSVTLGERNPEFDRALAKESETQPDPKKAKEAVMLKNVVEFKNDIRNGRYKYRVKAHPLQARDKQAYTEMWTQILQYAGNQSGVILPELIKALDVPGKAGIIAKLNENAQLRQQIAQLEEAAKASAGGAPVPSS